MNTVHVFNNEIEIGGFKIPADFKCIDGAFIKKFESLNYFERFNEVYSLIVGETVSVVKLDGLVNAEFPASIMSLDDNLAVVELFDGETATYLDYLKKESTVLEKISAVICLTLSVYVDLVETNLINKNDKINLAVSENDGLFALSTYIAMKIGVPINAVIVGGEKLKTAKKGALYTFNVNKNDVLDCLTDFFYDYDYVIDSVSAKSILANETYLDENGELFTVIFALVSPYYDARTLVKVVTDKSEIDVKKAIKKLYFETAIEIPTCIENGSVSPFFNFNNGVSFENLVKFL